MSQIHPTFIPLLKSFPRSTPDHQKHFPIFLFFRPHRNRCYTVSRSSAVFICSGSKLLPGFSLKFTALQRLINFPCFCGASCCCFILRCSATCSLRIWQHTRQLPPVGWEVQNCHGAGVQGVQLYSFDCKQLYPGTLHMPLNIHTVQDSLETRQPGQGLWHLQRRLIFMSSMSQIKRCKCQLYFTIRKEGEFDLSVS